MHASNNNSGKNFGGLSHLISLLNNILAKNARMRKDGNVASHATTTTLGQALRTCFTILYMLGYRLEDPQNLSQKHIFALVKHWHSEEKAISTIQSRLSALRIFCGWIGKKGMINSLPHYLPYVPKNQLKVRKVAHTSKGWSENNVDIIAKIEEANLFDFQFSLMLQLELAFGLRRIEVLQLRPWKSDHGNKLAIYQAKNGRPRDVYINTFEQRLLLDQVKIYIKKTENMGWKTTLRGKDASLKYNIGRYNKSMAKIGITKKEAGTSGHGLRAQFAENLALILEMIPPVLSGTSDQMSKDDLYIKRSRVSEALGHSRPSITGSYYGSYDRNVSQNEVNRTKKQIDKALKYLENMPIAALNVHNKIDCEQLLSELTLIDVHPTLSQIQHIWRIHSQRYGDYWIKPKSGNVIALEVAAMKVLSGVTK